MLIDQCTATFSAGYHGDSQLTALISLAGNSNYNENAEVGRGNDEDDSLLNRFGEKEDVDSLSQRGISRYDGYDDNEGPLSEFVTTLQRQDSPSHHCILFTTLRSTYGGVCHSLKMIDDFKDD